MDGDRNAGILYGALDSSARDEVDADILDLRLYLKFMPLEDDIAQQLAVIGGGSYGDEFCRWR